MRIVNTKPNPTVPKMGASRARMLALLSVFALCHAPATATTPASTAPGIAQQVATLSPSENAAALAPGVSSMLARLTPSVVFVPPTVEDPVDLAILSAHQALSKNDLKAFEEAAARVPRGHVLSSYLDYWKLRLRLQKKGSSDEEYQATAADVRKYIAKDPRALTSDLLRRDWMLAAGQRKDWPVIDAVFPKWVLQDESAPYCLASQSALAKVDEKKRPPTATLKKASGLLLKPQKLNGACTALLQTMADRKLLTNQQLQRRLNLALEINSPADIRLAASLQPKAPTSKQLDQALNKPAAALAKPQSPLLTKIALVRLARLDAERAARELMANKRLKMSTADRQFVWTQIGALGAQRLDSASLHWAKQGLRASFSDHTRVWLARAALAEQDWKTLDRIIAAMDSELKDSPTWAYWHGRAQLALGHPVQANRVFEKLATRHDYYGKLAREELGRPLILPKAPQEPPARLIADMDANPGIRQAMAFFSLGLRSEGNREWNYQMRGRDEQQLRAAAIWAARHGLLDRAINADERIRDQASYALRFPTPFAEQLLNITSQQRIDPAWVYGLIRQESRFVMQARSHVGASGLMQLMPGTASWVANQLGYADFKPSQINDIEVNLTFGSYYLRRTLEDLGGSPVLASAGYNAGPRRAHAWRSRLSKPVEGAIFAEMIPFSETRQYVKSVLSNTVDYAGVFTGEPQSLKSWLAVITPQQAQGTTPLP